MSGKLIDGNLKLLYCVSFVKILKRDGVVDRINIPPVAEYAYIGSLAGCWVAMGINVVLEFGSTSYCPAAASQFSEELFAEKLSACCRELRIGQLIVVPVTTMLVGTAVGALAGLTVQVARKFFRRGN